MGTIYIGCPEKIFTGGTELSHQLCYELCSMGYQAKMYYYGLDGAPIKIWNEVAESRFACYFSGMAESLSEIDKKGNILILPETAVALEVLFKNCCVSIWWMSVDNYLSSIDRWDDTVKDYCAMTVRSKDRLNFVQSKYAYDYCKDILGIPESNIVYLSDYINETYHMKNRDANLRKKWIFYNPKKGKKTIDMLMEKLPQYTWAPITGMSVEEIAEYFNYGRLYVDFGNHPGKDRIPREAACCGCCIITGREGAAGNDIDIPIPDKYKFDNVLEEVDRFRKLVDGIFDSYTDYYRDFGKYRIAISRERRIFKEQVAEMAELFKEKGMLYE